VDGIEDGTQVGDFYRPLCKHDSQTCTAELVSVRVANNRSFAMPLLGNVRVQYQRAQRRGTELTVATELVARRPVTQPSQFVPWASNQSAVHDARCMTAWSDTAESGLREWGWGWRRGSGNVYWSIPSHPRSRWTYHLRSEILHPGNPTIPHRVGDLLAED
jgi:hypothetical protein